MAAQRLSKDFPKPRLPSLIHRTRLNQSSMRIALFAPVERHLAHTEAYSANSPRSTHHGSLARSSGKGWGVSVETFSSSPS
jgi:hypothetical protein